MSRAMSRAISRDVTCVVENGIAHVRLARAEKLNGLTLGMVDELAASSRRLRRDRTLRAVILSGTGESFSAGLDFASVLRDPVGIARAFVPHPLRGTNTFQEACYGWRRLPVPVIAVVHGHCYGAGLQLAMGADFRFTTPDARWAVLESRWGLIPDMGGVRTLSEQVGLDVAKRLTMTGQVVSGRDAHALGLVTGVSEDPYTDAHELVEQVRSRSPDSVAAAKRLFTRTWQAGPRRTFSRERLEQLALLLSPNTAIAREAAFRQETPGFLPRAR